MPVPRNKKQLTVWVQPETTEKVKEMYKQADCRSRSEFVERAIRFYTGYITATYWLAQAIEVLESARNYAKEGK